jgi:hypothetical protein
MFAKIKSSNFIDVLKFQLNAPKGSCFRGVLKDDKGCVCRTIEETIDAGRDEITWTGLNDLPYGRYTLELSQGEEETDGDRLEMNLVKRV